jgi:hypothetical protein
MATIINADTSTGGAIITGDGSGELALQAAGNTGLTLNSSRAIGVGASPSFGTSGQVLTSAGTGSAPTWATPSAGAMNFITSVTASNSATVDVDNAMTAYDVYMIVADQIITTSGSNPVLALRLKVGGTYQTGASYQYHVSRLNASNTAYVSSASNGSVYSDMTSALNAGGPVSFVLYLYKPSNTTTSKYVSWQGGCLNSAATYTFIAGGATWSGSTAAITGIRFFTTSDNIVSGTFRLYGISNS